MVTNELYIRSMLHIQILSLARTI